MSQVQPFHFGAPSASATVAAPPASVTQQTYHVPPTCDSTFLPARDESLFVVSAPWERVVQVIGSFKDLTWSGNPPSSIRLNGTNNKPGTARFYNLQNLLVVETLLHYSRPLLRGTFVETHNTAPVDFGDITAYFLSDSISAVPYCGGLFTLLNYTAVFCSNKPDLALGLVHNLHTQDEANVQQMLTGSTKNGTCSRP